MLQRRWEGWYRGEYTIMFSSYEEFLLFLIDGADSDVEK